MHADSKSEEPKCNFLPKGSFNRLLRKSLCTFEKSDFAFLLWEIANVLFLGRQLNMLLCFVKMKKFLGCNNYLNKGATDPGDESFLQNTSTSTSLRYISLFPGC